MPLLGEVTCGVLLGRRSADDADPRAAQFKSAAQSVDCLGQESLAVIVSDPGELDAKLEVSRHCPGGIARENIDLATLQGVKASRRRIRPVFNSIRIPKRSSRQCPTEINIETTPDTGLVAVREPAQTFAHPTDQTIT